MTPAIFIVLGLIAIGGVAYLSYWFRKKRREGLALAAKRLGLSYSQDDTAGCLALPFALLRRGDGRGTENLLEGTWEGLTLREFDYWYYDESTDSQGHRTRSYSHFSCAVTELDAAMSQMSMARENVFTRIADSVGLDDIEFELDDFNRAFNVKARDRGFANALVDQRMMRWLMTTDASFAFETSGRWLLVFCRRLRPTELEPLLRTLKGFRDAIPRVVFDLYRSGGGP